MMITEALAWMMLGAFTLGWAIARVRRRLQPQGMRLLAALAVLEIGATILGPQALYMPLVVLMLGLTWWLQHARHAWERQRVPR